MRLAHYHRRTHPHLSSILLPYSNSNPPKPKSPNFLNPPQPLIHASPPWATSRIPPPPTLILVPCVSVKTVGLKRPRPPLSTPRVTWVWCRWIDGYFRRNCLALVATVAAVESEEEEVGESKGGESD
ncbi:hypothetical protein SLE2022_154980 [Rubroshorea leprosula]